MKRKSQTDWARVDALSDQDIDYSDIPELDEEFFRNATRFEPEAPRAKTKVTIRLKPETIQAFKDMAAKRGGSYQALINAVLDKYVDHMRP